MENVKRTAPATTADIDGVEFKCRSCGGFLEYAPAKRKLVCAHCGAEAPVPEKHGAIDEIDFERFIAGQYANEKTMDVVTVKCGFCGAEVTLRPHMTADRCPYCGSDLVLKDGSRSLVLKPCGLVPFCVDLERASRLFREWMSGRWFAPSDLRNRAAAGALDGVYIPYWTYDAETLTEYTGNRGTYYYVSETYTAFENGRPVTRTRQIRQTRWTPVSGAVANVFDDILVPASESLPDRYLYQMDSWDPKAVVPFSEGYLCGFRARAYEVDLKDGLAIAKKLMDPKIISSIDTDIGGDEQQVLTMRSSYSHVTFKHILLPLWISSYRYGGKVFHFLVNGQTGEVRGERPYSAVKIAFAVIAALIAVIIFLMLLQK